MKRLAYESQRSETQALSGVGKVLLTLEGPGAASMKACVSAGDKVEKGQLIGEPGEPGGASLHSPLAGEVKSLTFTTGQDGRNVEVVVIEGTEQGAAQALEPMKGGAGSLSGDSIRTRLCEAGVSPQGGNGRNALYTGLDAGESPEVLLVLCTDEEPLLQTQRQVLQDMPEKVAEGAALYQKAIGANRLVFAVTEDQKDLVSGETILAGKRYPAAHPEILMAQATGKYVLTSSRPRKDVHLINAETAAAVWDAVREGRPVTEKLVTVGMDDGEGSLMRVPLGTPISALLAKAGLEAGEGDRLITGRTWGRAQFDLERPVTKGTDGLFLQKGKQVFLYEDVACIGCGACVKACPMKIPVNMMTRNCEYGKVAEAVAYDLESCIECGLCAYVCKTRRPLLQYILFAKKEKQKLDKALEEKDAAAAQA